MKRRPKHAEPAVRADDVARAAGAMVRCAAIARPHGLAHVLFRDRHGRTVGRLMTVETYRAIPYGFPATPDDYAAAAEALGLSEIAEAPGAFH